jgi:hypothetical protein
MMHLEQLRYDLEMLIQPRSVREELIVQIEETDGTRKDVGRFYLDLGDNSIVLVAKDVVRPVEERR